MPTESAPLQPPASTSPKNEPQPPGRHRVTGYLSAGPGCPLFHVGLARLALATWSTDGGTAHSYAGTEDVALRRGFSRRRNRPEGCFPRRLVQCSRWLAAAIASPIGGAFLVSVPGAAVTLVISGSAFATLAALRTSPPDIRQVFPHEFAAIELPSPEGLLGLSRSLFKRWGGGGVAAWPLAMRPSGFPHLGAAFQTRI